jgi:alkaline phosphatase
VDRLSQSAKNVIFLVSDGMSAGTWQMAELFATLKTGRSTAWVDVLRNGQVARAAMDTASANSWVTDSAAASSAWGGGVRVNNGALNVGPDGQQYQPILQKFKAAGKAVGCVTTVPITHATPAGFCVNQASRGDQADIATDYLQLRLDCMLGAGLEYFLPSRRADKRDLLAEYRQAGFHVATSRDTLAQLPPAARPLMGVFFENSLPYDLDHRQDADLLANVPTLADMTRAALRHLSTNDRGFVVQIEAGKVDWAAHANDALALIHDQLAFDEAVRVALEFAAQDGETLVVVTTDHGNANPGLLGTSGANEKFQHLLDARHSNTWVMEGLKSNWQVAEIRQRLQFAQGLEISETDARVLHEHIAPLAAEEKADPRKMPYAKLAKIQQALTGIGWAGDDHSGDFVELTLLGPGSELLPSFIRNCDLHRLLLNATGVADG